MKKITILTLISLFSLGLSAQSIYFKAFGGYGFNINGEFVTEKSSYYYENDDSINNYYTYKAFEVANGKGSRYGLAIGIDLSQNIAFEIGVLHTKSKTPEVTYIDNIVRDFGTPYYVDFFNSYYLETSSWQFSPEIAIKCNPALFVPYLKLGAIFGTTEIRDYYSISLTTNLQGYYPFANINEVLEYEKKSSVGFTSTVGCDINLADNFYIFTELRYSNIYCTPTKGEIIEYNVNGNDELKSLSNNERYFEFVESYSEAENYDPDQPRKLIYQRFSLNNISILAGLKIQINFKKNSKSK